MENPEFHKFSENIVTEFLNTVVIIDDEPTISDTQKASKTKTPEGTAFTFSETNQAKDIHDKKEKIKAEKDKKEKVDIKETSHPIDYTITATSFALKGIISNLIRPESKTIENTIKIIKKLLYSTDIFIIDWKILNDRGKTATNLIKLIIKDSCDTCPTQLRLIVIYTGEQGLEDIFDKINTEIKNISKTIEPILNNSNLEINYGPNKIIILAKEGTRVAAPYKNKVISNKELPDAIINEFTLMTKGLMRNALMKGLTQIRKNAFKLLNKFPSELDPSYLTHHILQKYPKDAEDHLAKIITSEIKTILLDGIINQEINSQTIMMYLKNKHLQCEKLDFNAKDLVINGWYKSKSNNIKEFPPDEIENIKLKAINNLTKSVNIYVHNISKSNEKFAHLMCIKTNYENRNPILSLGTIIKIDEANKQLFLFCIQPRCDCVRINKKENNFIFIPLVQIKSKSKYNREQLIICIDNNEYIRFKVQIKANCLYNIIIIQDKIGKNNPIITKQGENNEYYFTGIINGNEKKFKWICEVKDDIAQKYANDLAANLSRVGVDLPEWMAINK